MLVWAGFLSLHQSRERTMNKNELVAEVATRTKLPKGVAATTIEAVFDAITDTLRQNGEVRFVGFGTFMVQRRKGGIGRNPRTGEEIRLKDSKQAKFRPGKSLKEALT